VRYLDPGNKRLSQKPVIFATPKNQHIRDRAGRMTPICGPSVHRYQAP
jgi:hypothetical protein